MSQTNAEWNDYWRQVRRNKMDVDPTGTDATAPFFLAEGPPPDEAKYVIDLGCGSGPLSGVLSSANYDQSMFVGVDLSIEAAQLMADKDGLSAVQSDLASLPMMGNTVDWVISQFALEYASEVAWQEASRVVRPGGRFTAVMHSVGSFIYEQHERARSHFLELDRVIHENHLADFRAQSQHFEGNKRLEQALAAVKEISRHQKIGLATPTMDAWIGFINQLLSPSNQQSAISSEALWDRLLVDYEQFKGRIDSMLSAALTPVDFMAVQQGFVDAGFDVVTAGLLTIPNGQTMGFKLSARKASDS